GDRYVDAAAKRVAGDHDPPLAVDRDGGGPRAAAERRDEPVARERPVEVTARRSDRRDRRNEDGDGEHRGREALGHGEGSRRVPPSLNSRGEVAREPESATGRSSRSEARGCRSLAPL